MAQLWLTPTVQLVLSEITGSATGTITGSHDECGGSYTESWTFTDECSRTITATRTITVDPAPQAVFAPVSNTTIACGSAPPVGTALAYTNSATGACEITGSATGTITGSHDECGGSYTESWTFTDECSRVITATRTITVLPAPVAAFAATLPSLVVRRLLLEQLWLTPTVQLALVKSPVPQLEPSLAATTSAAVLILKAGRSLMTVQGSLRRPEPLRSFRLR
ncbi:MAG: hypothetical protein IPL86_16800 [Flavobacteriales bacterium]|nr:hypothetical protein [Flavobacteriales bacterium]